MGYGNKEPSMNYMGKYETIMVDVDDAVDDDSGGSG